MSIKYNEKLHLTGFTVLCVMVLIVEVMFEVLIYLAMGFNMIVAMLICANIVTLILFILTIYNNKNVDIETMKNKGEKIKTIMKVTDSGGNLL